MVRRHGKGIFIVSPSIDYHIAIRTSFTETLETLGVATQSRALRKQRLHAQGGVAKRLQLNDGDEVMFLETLREVDEKPFCVCSHFLPVSPLQGLLEYYNSGSLHQFLEENCNTRLRRKESLVSAVIPTKDDSALLNMPHNVPILRVKSLNVCEHNESLLVRVTRFREMTQLAILPKS